MSIMWFLSVLLCVSTIAVPSFGFLIQNGEPLCPPPEEVEPCSCFKDSEGKVTALCTGVSNERIIEKVFSKNPGWNLQHVGFDHFTMDYIPSSILRNASFQQLIVTSSTLVSLFDAPLTKTPEIDLLLYDVKILRGVQWELFSNSSLVGFGAFSMEIKNFGNSFKEHMPQVLKNLWFQNTKTVSIKDQAFQRMVNVERFALMGGSLKKISRDMFPRPWNVEIWNLSEQKLAALPKDIFADLPKLKIFVAETNFFTTISEEVFTKNQIAYFLNDNPIVCNCDVKWITTSKEFSNKTLNKMFTGTCAEPQSFKGRGLYYLKEEDFRYCR